jgi:hypothetical protein
VLWHSLCFVLLASDELADEASKKKASYCNQMSRRTASRNTFLLDVDEYVDYNCKVYIFQTICFGFPNLLCAPCVYANLKDFATAVKVTITNKELRFERDQIKTCWRLSCCDSGRIEKTIPLNRIIDVVLIEPAGGFPPKTLYILKIQTASNSGVNAPELVIEGLKKEDAIKVKSLLLKNKTPTTMDRL